jgi:hypothetical protein
LFQALQDGSGFAVFTEAVQAHQSSGDVPFSEQYSSVSRVFTGYDMHVAQHLDGP